jgi:hypothetical protein
MFPLGSIVMPPCPKKPNVAAVPSPSALPLVSLPAIIAVVPVDVVYFTSLLPSVAKMFPSESIHAVESAVVVMVGSEVILPVIVDLYMIPTPPYCTNIMVPVVVSNLG